MNHGSYAAISERCDDACQAARRKFLGQCGLSLGQIALASLLAGGTGLAHATERRALPRPPHFQPRAKRAVFLFMEGGPSHLDLFDHKPRLIRHAGQPLPSEIIKNQRYAFIQPDARVLGPQFAFSRHGRCGAELSDCLPHLARIVDEIAIVKSVHTDQFNHAPAQIFMTTGSPLPGRPSVGAWLSYGLGSEADDLPAFVVLSSGLISGGNATWSSGFMPSEHAGVLFRSVGPPILNASSPAGFDRQLERDTLDAIRALERQRLEVVGDPRIASRIAAYEMAYRMQSRAPQLTDFASEPPHVLKMYGAAVGETSFANNCLLARRLLERGVRFVSIFQTGWDHHSEVANGLTKMCGSTDQASAALVMDLKQRGMLEDTLVIWGGEFGRTPMVESSIALDRSQGRDHHPQAFTMWLAGGGVKPGLTYGRTDEFGFNIVEDPVHVHDLQATIMHLLGIDHEQLTFRFQGRDHRLTDVHGKVINALLA